MPKQREAPPHSDSGLQPERTDLAWERTTMSMVVAAAVFLRWMPHHGWFAGTLIAAAILTAAVVSLTRKRRFHRATTGINQEHMTPNLASVGIVASSVVILALLGIYTVLFLPLQP